MHYKGKSYSYLILLECIFHTMFWDIENQAKNTSKIRYKTFKQNHTLFISNSPHFHNSE